MYAYRALQVDKWLWYNSSGISYTMYKKYLVKSIFKKYLCQDTFQKYLEDTI